MRPAIIVDETLVASTKAVFDAALAVWQADDTNNEKFWAKEEARFAYVRAMRGDAMTRLGTAKWNAEYSEYLVP